MSEPSPQLPEPRNVGELIGMILGFLALIGAIKGPDGRTMLPTAEERRSQASTVIVPSPPPHR